MGELTQTRREPVRVRVRKRRRRRRRRRTLLWLLGMLGLLAVAAALTLVPAFAARARLAEARAAMEEGRAALSQGQVGEAQTAFTAAESAFLRARAHARNPLMRVASFLPLLGRTPDAVEVMAEAGAFVARGAEATTSALDGLPGGLGDLAPRNGTIPLEPLGAMAPHLSEARDFAFRAQALLDTAPSSWLLGPVADARETFVTELDTVTRTLDAAAALSRDMPAFLGQGGTRHYFFGAQNPAELRGTGGFIGAYAIVTATDGRLRFSRFDPIDTLEDRDPDDLVPPNPDFAARYDQFGGAGFWRNINSTPDFPSAAVAIERLYQEVRGTRLDGAIVADPFALEALLAVSGSVEVAGTTMTAENAVEFLTHDAYSEFRDSATRKRLLGDAARAVFRRFLTKGAVADPVAAARALIRTSTDGHMLLHSTDPAVQSGFLTAGIGGALEDPEGDYIAVSAINAAGNKADYYAERSIRYQVHLGAGGAVTAGTSVELTNEAPSAGEPSYVIGPYDETFQPGENVTYLSTFCAEACRLESFRRAGASAEVGSEEELGHPVFPVLVRLPSGGTETLEYDWTVPDAWEGNDGAGRYRLTFQGQTTIRPTHLTVDIRAPEGMSIVSASPGMRVEGSRAVWEGEPAQTMRFEVEFERPMLERAWRAVVRFLSYPLIEL